MASWGISSWLVCIRSLQILGTLVSAALNGFLLVYINAHQLGLASSMFSLEIMTCVTLIYTAIVLLAQHTGQRHLAARTSLITIFIVGDVILTGLLIAVISILARTGVPSNCAGLTRSDFESGDAPDQPPNGYDTIRFGDGSNKGVLDKYCALERSYYFISIAMLFSYMATVTLSVLRIFEGFYTKNSLVNERLLTASELVRLESKVSRTQRSPIIRQSATASSPLHEGITSPRSFSSRYSLRDPARRSTPTISPLTSPPNTLDPAREGLLIDQSGTDQAAEAATVADGYRNPGQTGTPALPPYTPGESSRFMPGYGNEDNEMRLSEYVKGGTRAQDMKDAGNDI